MENITKTPDFEVVATDTMFEYYTSVKSFNGQTIALCVNKMTAEVLVDYQSVMKALNITFEHPKQFEKPLCFSKKRTNQPHLLTPEEFVTKFNKL